jgi:hypothetical protein
MRAQIRGMVDRAWIDRFWGFCYLHLCKILSIVGEHGAPTTAIRMSGPIRTAIMCGRSFVAHRYRLSRRGREARVF